MQDASLIGITLAGRFRVTGVIGEGGMATVYRAQQEVEPHDVAIKVMSPELAKDTRFVRRFRREAKAASMLKHPNTVSILEFGVDQGYVFLAMECLEGHDLALMLHRERRISEVRAVHILVQVCKALSAAHELSIVHRDLKPDNIMIVKQPKGSELPLPNMNPNDFVKVLDFGIAKILDEDTSKGSSSDARAEPTTSAKSMLTRVGTIVGTPAYMAPEQGRAEQVDGRTDVYACGVLLYELLTGRVPFSGETPMQVVMRHVNEPPDPPSKFIPVEASLERCILKSLAKWPTERQQSAADLAAELTALLPRLSTEKRQPSDASAGAGAPLPAPRPAAGAPAPQAPPPQARPQVSSTQASSTQASQAQASQAQASQAQASSAQASQAQASSAQASSAQAPQAQASSMQASQAHQGGPRPKSSYNPLDGSTLVMEPGPPPKGPGPSISAQKPVTAGAPAFPTLNIDVPADMLADIDAKLAAGSAAAAKPFPAPSPMAPPKPVVDEAPVDSDDEARTLVAHDVPMTRQSLANIGHPPPLAPASPFGEDDLRTMLAQARSPSIPDLSQPLGGLPGSALGGPPAQDKSTTLVSALPNDSPGAASRTNPAPSTLKALKGTAKMDPVEISMGIISPSPTTKPSPVALGLDSTQALEPSLPGGPAAAPKPSDSGAKPTAQPSGVILPVPVGDRLAAEQAFVVGEPAAVAVWQPKRRRLTGPVAMMLGILIGALLFAIVFAALFLIKPS